jgi:molecular chaperone GrpE
MAKPNGKNDGKDVDLENLEHELPPAEDDGFVEEAGAPEARPQPADELAKLRAERDALLDRLARMQAEFDNARKRAQREQQEHRDYAVTDAVKALLPILDSFERAFAHRDNTREFQAGMELINKQLHDALAKLGVKAIEAQGHPFDPHVHEAIEMVDTDKAKDNTVLDELQRGYRIKDRLLRPAMVRVARNHKK